MINKELLSAVLDNEVPYQVKVHKIIIKNNSLNYFYNSKDSGGGLFEANEYINIYELAYKCKEWALNIGYSLESITNRSCIMGNNYEYYASVKIHKATNSMIEHNIDEDTETKAIFKACQWILDNKDNK